MAWLEASAALDGAPNAGRTEGMLFVDVMLRIPAVTLLWLLALLAWRDARHLIQGRIVIVLGITLGAMLLSTAPAEIRPPSPLYEGLRLIDTANIVFVWWFGLSLFEDNFRLRKLHWGGLALYLVFGMWGRINYLMGNPPLWIGLDIIVRLISAGIILHLLWKAVSGWQDDLIEARRRTRLWYTIATAIATTLIVVGEIVYSLQTGDRSDPAWLSTSRSAIALPVIMFGTWWFLTMRAEYFLFEPTHAPVLIEPRIDPKDTATHTRLVAAMETDLLYREQGLGIGDLATKLNVPEHQLRALINKGLGYRNFASFLNQYRLAEAKAALADPEQARTPILTIAMDVGYASLATFNRAFKSEEGTTPSAFRAKALESAAQS
ncbi:MAG: AraC family transcriptional regulator [Pseudomonadota bacterium]